MGSARSARWWCRSRGASEALEVGLERFELVSSGFSGPRTRGLPRQIGVLDELRTLIFCHNVIDVFPPSFFELERLEVLDLHVCQLPVEVPDELAALRELRQLDVSSTGWDTLAGIARLRSLLPHCQVGERFE